MPLASLLDVPAPAKLNLFLHVVGRRGDGYHLLESVFVLIDWCDALHFERRADGRLHRHDLGPELPADDLSLKAARALQQASGTGYGCDLSVDKRVPWGAGLGGGSSDAATTLLALNRLWGLGWPRARLQALAATLGADVPFFVGGRNAFVQGIGERLEPVDLAPQRFHVVKPAASLATAAVFGAGGLVRDTPPVILPRFLADTPAPSDEAYGRNDLQPVAEALCPEVAEAARWLRQHHGNSRMTGSGSAVFARIAKVAEKVGVQDPPGATVPPMPAGWVGRTCRSLLRHPLVDWAD